MPVFFICFILFVIWMHVKSNQTNKNNPTWDQNYWERERQSNFARKKSIDNLDYIQVSENDLPFSDAATGEEEKIQQEVQNIMAKKMLNLSGQSNTDLKLAYGTSNFTALSEYDQTYSLFIRSLSQWGHYLYKNTPQEDQRVQQILEYAVSLGSDITDTYLILAQIYLNQNQIEKIQELIDHVAESDFYMKDSIIHQLKQIIQSYH